MPLLDMNELKKSIKDHLDMPGLLDSLLDGAIEEALDKLVKDSSNPYDDMLKAALYPHLKSLLGDQFKSLWDKLLEPEAPQP